MKTSFFSDEHMIAERF